MTQHVWISNIIRNHDTEWLDYNLSVEGKIDSQFLLQYSHILSQKERQETEGDFKKNNSNYVDLIVKYKEKKIYLQSTTRLAFIKCLKSIWYVIKVFLW